MTTAQEEAWKGPMGDHYTTRQTLPIETRRAWLERALIKCNPFPETIIEFGANAGDNLRALRQLLPDAHLTGVEINGKAARQMEADIVMPASVLDFPEGESWELCMTRGLLIHVPPEKLPIAYATLYRCSERHILIAEYYSPQPRVIPYQGQVNLLWARDFAGEMLTAYRDLRLVDYGFIYHRDPVVPQDDITWFLLKKEAI